MTNGAPQVILELLRDNGQAKPAVEKAVNDFAARGFRSLGVVRADGDGEWQFVVLGTQIVATLIAVYGLFMTPLGWCWAGFVWGYALLWFLINDRVKLLAFRIFDPVKTIIVAVPAGR